MTLEHENALIFLYSYVKANTGLHISPHNLLIYHANKNQPLTDDLCMHLLSVIFTHYTYVSMYEN